jgi:hypothetical protein
MAIDEAGPSTGVPQVITLLEHLCNENKAAAHH